jgi:hypothetical protein
MQIFYEHLSSQTLLVHAVSQGKNNVLQTYEVLETSIVDAVHFLSNSDYIASNERMTGE